MLSIKTKLLLLSLFTPLLCGVSFAFNPFDNYPQKASQVGGLSYNIVQGKEYCVYFKGGNSNGVSFNSNISASWGCYNNTINFSNSNEGTYCFNACQSSSNYQFTSQYNYSSIEYYLYEFDNPLPSSEDCSIVENELVQCMYDNTSIQSQLNTCSNSLSGTSANLSQCQSDLSSCSNGCDTLVNQCLNDKSILSGSLATCIEDKTSLQNYNNSLSNQLNECLSSGTGGIGSGVFLGSFDLFWKDGNINYSLPITNNLFLPYGYKGKLNDGVLSITKNNSSEYSLSIDDLSFDNDVVAMLGKLFVFFMSLGLFCVFLYTIRRYFIGLKSIK